MAAEFSVTMKLLVDTQSNRVLFAEASKECVDLLFHMLSLPIATVIRLLREDGMVGSVENLYKSIENLHESYVLQQHNKDSLLKPNFKPCTCSVPMLQLQDAVASAKNFYRCCNCSISTSIRIADDPEAICPNCSRKMNIPITYVAPPAANAAAIEGGLVKGVVTYMVMDDLVVTPMSTISCITLLNKFNVADVSVLHEKIVNLGFDEAVRLLKASLHSKKVLTEVFLTKTEPKVIVEEPVKGGDAVHVNRNESKAAVEEQEVELCCA